MQSKAKIIKKLSALTSTGVISAIALMAASPAQASLEGGFILDPTAGAGATFTGFGVTTCDVGLGVDPNDGECNPLTSLDRLAVGAGGTPPEDFGTPGDANVTNSFVFMAFDDFAPFVLSPAMIKDLPVGPGPAPGNINGFPPPTVPDYIRVFNPAVAGPIKGFTLDLTEALGIPVYSQVGNQTSVSIPYGGEIYKLDASGDRTDDPFTPFEAIFTVDFAGSGGPAQVRQLFDEDGEKFGPIGYTDTIVANKVPEVPEGVPEGSNLISLLGLGLVGAGSLLINRIKHNYQQK